MGVGGRSEPQWDLALAIPTRVPQHKFTGNSLAGPFKRNRRCAIEEKTRLECLVVSTGSFPADREHMGGVAGSVCIVMECPAAVIWELATPAGHLGDQRSLSQLEDALRVCFPSLFVDKILSIEVHPGAIESGLGLPILAESAFSIFHFLCRSTCRGHTRACLNPASESSTLFFKAIHSV